MGPPRITFLAALLGVAATLSTSCKDSTGPSGGTIAVVVASTGTDIDPDGYQVTVDGGTPHSIAASGTISISGLTAGEHTVNLTGLATNCAAGAPNPVTATVAAGKAVSAAFAVTCVARVGTLIVVTTTLGNDPDPNGYNLGVDGRPPRTITANSTDTIGMIREGSRLVSLTDIATNCFVSSNPRAVTFGYGDTVSITFQVACAVRNGSIQVTTTTSGVDLGPDVYLVAVDGGTAAQIGRSSTFTFVGVHEGVHTVSLSGLASNCVVGAPHPRSVTVVYGQTVSAPFNVTCVARVGAIRVTTTTTGAELDPNGYSLYVDYQSPRAIAVNGSQLFAGLRVDEAHTVTIGDIERNCVLDGPAYRYPLTVTFGDTLNIAFSIQCVQTGALQVSVATAGVELDGNGYSLRVVGANLDMLADITINGTVTIARLVPGEYVVSLVGVAGNCDATSPNPRTITVVAGATTPNAFDVQCGPTQQLAFYSIVGGNAEIYVIKSNGSSFARLTTNQFNDVDPDWSPDGSKIAFRSERDGNAEIYVMNADGSNAVRLTNLPTADYQPVWSPDGTRIAFTSLRAGNSEIYVMNADGSNAIRLTNHVALDAEPAWSPDGSRIAFRSNRDGNAEIYIMNADGSSPTRLTYNELDDLQPAWSPDGTKIAFSRGVCDPYYGCYGHSIFTITTAGTNLTRLTSGYDDIEPTWSPDGRKVAYASTSCDYYYGCYSNVAIVRVDGLTVADVIWAGGYQPAWRR